MNDALRAFADFAQVLFLGEAPGGGCVGCQGRRGGGEIGHSGSSRLGKAGQVFHPFAGRAHGIVSRKKCLFEIERRKAANQRAHRGRLFLEKLFDGGCDRLLLEAPGIAWIGHREFRIHRGEHRVLFQQPRAEPMHRGYPGPFELGADLRTSLGQLGAYVGGGLFGEGDGENALRVCAGLHQLAKMFHQDSGLAGAGTGHHAGVERRPGNFDCRALGGSENDFRHAPSTAATGTSMRQTSRH